MYIQEFLIYNIKSIAEFGFQLNPNEQPGWHVFIGENGSGKSSIIRAISLGLLGSELAPALRENWDEWLKNGSEMGRIEIKIDLDKEFDELSGYLRKGRQPFIISNLVFERSAHAGDKWVPKREGPVKFGVRSPTPYLESDDQSLSIGDLLSRGPRGWFSAAYGPFRRFRGGDKDKEKLFHSYPRVGAHITAYGEDAALTEVESWFRELFYASRDKPEFAKILNNIQSFINKGSLLPQGVILKEINADGVFFQDGNGSLTHINELSDGFRSILSLTMELIRQLIREFGPDRVFSEVTADGNANHIPIPGVVLIDEIDAHLHPTWQVKIGQWFTSHFPRMQFIVTTHSPLVCRAAVNGSIWRLATPGTDQKSGRVTGHDLNRLLFGNVLDAFGTEVFGGDLIRSAEGQEKYKQLARLNLKFVQGKLSEAEKLVYEDLKAMFPSG